MVKVDLSLQKSAPLWALFLLSITLFFFDCSILQAKPVPMTSTAPVKLSSLLVEDANISGCWDCSTKSDWLFFHIHSVKNSKTDMKVCFHLNTGVGELGWEFYGSYSLRNATYQNNILTFQPHYVFMGIFCTRVLDRFEVLRVEGKLCLLSKNRRAAVKRWLSRPFSWKKRLTGIKKHLIFRPQTLPTRNLFVDNCLMKIEGKLCWEKFVADRAKN